MHAMTDDRWSAVMRKDPSADGRFVYAVRSTGVYCRPSCPSKRPKRERVEFFADAPAAERAGYRACLRCKPNNGEEEHMTNVRQACRAIELNPRATLIELASRAAMSPYHFQRVFKRMTGVTPKQYAIGCDGRSSRNVTRNEPIEFAAAQSSLGRLLVAWTDRGVCFIAMGDDDRSLEADLRRRFPRATFEARRKHPWLANVLRMIDQQPASPLPLDIRGTAFQRRVWLALQEIPRGEKRTYAQVAAMIGEPGAVRAVGSACGANPVAVVVPCHRVLRSDGGLGGYRWGIARKEKLLRSERPGGLRRAQSSRTVKPR
jgi:AraC family transcriptional regulator of adaptative response/methylated-DNA-[protein]-cysteine methyltransferase